MSNRPAIIGFTVEPFKEGQPGQHVIAAIDAANAAGLSVEMAPFSNIGYGDVGTIAAALEQIVLAAFTGGATRISLQVTST